MSKVRNSHLEGVCVVERELLRSRHRDGVPAASPRDEVDERRLAAALHEALRGALLAHHERQSVDIHRVLDQDVIVLREGEVVEERVALEVHPALRHAPQRGVVLGQRHARAHARELQLRAEAGRKDELIPADGREKARCAVESQADVPQIPWCRREAR